MGIPTYQMTIDEFLTWSEQQPKETGRFELWDGRIITKRGPPGAMNAERAAHWTAKFELANAFKRAIRAARVEAHLAVDGAAVPIGTGKCPEPDVVVYLGARRPKMSLTIPEPVVIAEVLSPSTANFDRNEKRDAYFELPSMQHYLIVDPIAPAISRWVRGETGPEQGADVAPGEHLSLDAPDLQLELDEFWRELSWDN
ncbi:MAG: Uma2 family endonuclease [Pseudomonadota bacterium]